MIQKALAGANVSDAATERTRNQDPERSSLPNGRISSRDAWSANTLPATSNATGQHLTKDADIQSGDTSKDFDAKNKAVEVLNIIRKLGFTVSKDLTQAPKVQNPGSAASNKSENQVTCDICQKFRGRPCEMKYILLLPPASGHTPC